jgi:hypothetical protein
LPRLPEVDWADSLPQDYLLFMNSKVRMTFKSSPPSVSHSNGLHLTLRCPRALCCNSSLSRPQVCYNCRAAALQVLFKTVRVDKARFAGLKPVMIHVNYHVRSWSQSRFNHVVAQGMLPVRLDCCPFRLWQTHLCFCTAAQQARADAGDCGEVCSQWRIASRLTLRTLALSPFCWMPHCGRSCVSYLLQVCQEGGDSAGSIPGRQ